MKSILVLSVKGGVGKSTAAVNLAVASIAAGQVAGVVDVDPQASATAWARVRTAKTPLVVTVGSDDLHKALGEARQMGYASVWVDSAGANTSDLTEDVREVDFALVPILPSPADVLTAFVSADLAKAAGTPFAFVLNSVPARSPEAASAREVLARLGPVCAAELGDRLAFRRAFGAGLGVVESDPGSPADVEVRALFTEVWSLANGKA